MRFVLTLFLICALETAVQAQDKHDWQSLARLQAGDRILLHLKTGRVAAVFQSWTLQQITAGTVTAKREDVLKIERYRPGGWSRGKNAAVGALIGFGGGFAIGAAAGGCRHDQFGPCFSRGEVGAVIGALGMVIGATLGALLPRHTKDLIYTVR